VETIADTIGITGLLERTTRTLSGGETALVALATALVGLPSVLVLDEFDSHLDWKNAQLVTDVVRDAGIRYLLQCTQNMDLAIRADHLLYLEEGRVRLAGRAQDVFPALCGSCFYPPSWRFPA
jgi:energy-coupling factor transporter ATP-binding protein EcfA2